MALRVGIVGLPNSGKTTLFNALTQAGAQVTAYADVAQKPNLGMAVIVDDRLDRLAEVVGSRKVTPAAIRIVDVPGRAEVPGELRQADALLGVLDGFSDGADPAADLETLRLELVVADRDHVERRLERVRKEAKSGDRGKRQEVELTERRLHVEGRQPVDATDRAGGGEGVEASGELLRVRHSGPECKDPLEVGLRFRQAEHGLRLAGRVDRRDERLPAAARSRPVRRELRR